MDPVLCWGYRPGGNIGACVYIHAEYICETHTQYFDVCSILYYGKYLYTYLLCKVSTHSRSSTTHRHISITQQAAHTKPG